MSRILVDGRGRTWRCDMVSLLPEEATHSVPGRSLTDLASVAIRCRRGNQRVMLRVPLDWEQIPDEELRDLLENKLRERGHA